MGPTSFNVGDVSARDPDVEPARLQWGRRLSTSETVARSTLVEDGDVQLQWGRRLSTSETATVPTATLPANCFNGADVFQRRRQTR